MNNRPSRRTTSRINPNNPSRRANFDPAPAEQTETRRELLRLRGWQNRLLYLVWAASAIAIGLYFANLIFLAQFVALVATLSFAGLCWVSYLRYKRNRERREEILAHLDVMQDDQLRNVFNEARRERGLPPDERDTTGYTATINRERARIAAKTGRPNRVERLQAKDNNNNGKGTGNGGKQA